MRKQFYEKALPSQGLYCAAGIDKDGRTYHRFAESLSDLEGHVVALQNEGLNVFVALHTFSQRSRKAECAQYCKTLFIDLDVDTDNAKKYTSKEEALEALDDFIKVSELPPPVRIDSGNGIHAYWILDRNIPSAEWKPYANKFKKLCLDHLKIDPAVTADVARILRCPETLHLKGEPKSVKFLDTDFTEYDFDLFKEYLGEAKVEASSILDLIPKGLDEDTKKIAKFDNYETIFQDIAQKSLEGSGCNQIKHILTNARTLEEPLWYAGLSIARHCTDWEDAIHLMSEDHPEYSRDNTIKKANQSFGKPFSCEKFNELNPGGCEKCVFRGRITNPLAVGRRVVEAETVETYTPEDAIRVETNTKEIPAFPAYLKPFVRGKNGGIYYVPPPEVDEDGEKHQPEPMMLSVNDFFPIKRKFSDGNGEIYVVRLLMPHETREFDVPMEIFNSLDAFKKAMGKMGVTPPNQKLWPMLVDYMTKWAHYLQAQAAAEIVRGQMGWTEESDAFVIGKVEIQRDQSERKTAVSSLVKGVAKMFEPRGSYEKWQKSANQLNREGFEMHAFAMAMAFGSPLMRLCSTKGMTFCFKGNTGGAKSGAMIGAVSVFASPIDASVFKATDNGFVMRALNFKNIFLGIDEVKDKDPKELSNLIHSIAQGKGKIRMQSSVNAERELELSAALISLWTSNESMIDKLFAAKRNPTGEIARYMEYHIARPDYLAENPDAGAEIFDPFNYNYGWAGPIFIKKLMTFSDAELIERIKYWHNRIKKTRFGSDVTYRFFENATSASFAGLEIAIEAGIVNYNIDRIFDHVILQSIMVRDKTVKDNAVDYEALLTEFFFNNHTGILIFKDGHCANEIYGKLVGRVDMDTGHQYISKTAFREFLVNTCKVSTDEMETVLSKKGVLIETKKMRLSTGWKGGVWAPIATYNFKTEIPKDFLDKFNESKA